MDDAEFHLNLSLYGADIASWPNPARAQAALAQSPALRAALAQEQRFEALAAARPQLPEDAAFARRIIAAAASPTPRAALAAILREIAESLPFPRPAYAFASVVLAGFAAGVLLHTPDAAATTSFDTLLFEETL